MGLQYISAGLERQVLYLYPTLVILMTMLRDKARPAISVWIALATSYLGLMICFGDEWKAAGSEVALGASLVFAAAFAYAIFTVMGESWNRRLGSMRFLSLAYITGTGFLLGKVGLSGFDWAEAPPSLYGYGLALAFACTLIPVFLFGFALSKMGGVQVSILSALGPVLTLVLAFQFLGEPAGKSQWLGLMLVIGGALILTLGRRDGFKEFARTLAQLRQFRWGWLTRMRKPVPIKIPHHSDSIQGGPEVKG
jgi:drug/metabolite transporter (DMT)-like permease